MRSYKPEKIKELFSDYMGDPLKIIVEKKEYILDMRMNDLAKLMGASEEAQDGGTESSVEKIGEVILHMLYRAYLPFWDEAKDIELEGLSEAQKEEQSPAKVMLSNFVVKNYNVIFTQIGEELGWISKAQAKNIDKKVEKLKSLGSQPQQ